MDEQRSEQDRRPDVLEIAGEAPQPDVGGARVAIIGGGWFGCCIATDLRNSGVEVTVLEAREQVFTGASGHNQFRLHLGFHYPRSHQTREQTRIGFRWFMQHYPEFSTAVESNVYGICEEASLLDFDTYLQVMRAAGLRFDVHDPAEFGLQKVEGCLTCGERRIETARAREWFTHTLADSLQLGTPVETIEPQSDGVLVNGERYDLVVNCSNQTFASHAGWQVIYEPCVTLLYEGAPEHPALTLMDGPFFTIYPYTDELFTVYSVVHTRCCKLDDPAAAHQKLHSLTGEEIAGIRTRIEEQILEYYPAFREQFRFADIHRSVRSIFPDRSDARPCRVVDEGRVLQVMAGKIDAVFYAVDEVRRCVAAYCSPAEQPASPKSSQPWSRSA